MKIAIAVFLLCKKKRALKLNEKGRGVEKENVCRMNCIMKNVDEEKREKIVTINF